MYTIKARCGSCEHIWDIAEYGFESCPLCGSPKMDVTSENRDEFFSTCAGPSIPTIRRNRPNPAIPGLADTAKPLNTLIPKEAVVGLIWIIVCSVAAGLFVGLSVPPAALPTGLLVAAAGAILAIKIILVCVARSFADPEVMMVGETTLGSAQAVGYCVIDVVLWAGLAMFLGIWWPTAAVCCLLIYTALGCISVLVVMGEVVLKLRTTGLMVVAYSVMVAAGGYYILQYSLVG